MSLSSLSSLHSIRRTPLAACMAGVFVLSSALAADGSMALPALASSTAAHSHFTSPGPIAPDCAAGDAASLRCSRVSLATGAAGDMTDMPSPQTLQTVTNCNDSDPSVPGELRYEAAHAASGDTIEMAGLTCGSITLYYGAIAVAQTDLTLHGPGRSQLVITGAYAYHAYELDRILNHGGTGLLSISGLSVAYGRLATSSGNAMGGCIYSAGSVALDGAGVYNCRATNTTSGRAQGGGVFAKGTLALSYSVVSGNSALESTGGSGYGGGVYAVGTVQAMESTVSGNTAGKSHGFGGGVFAYAGTVITRSTISGNTARDNGGGIYNHRFFNTANYATTITNSTISGNNAGYHAGGITTSMGSVAISNSTIFANTAGRGRSGTSPPFTYYAPGLATDDSNGPMTVTLQSTLIANNTYGGTSIEYDLSVPKRSSTTVTFNGANNLVRATFAAVPSDTIKLSCPLLGTLRNNGGPTKTLALLSASPGIDQGNNTANLSSDQRGPPFARVSGSKADIGAYEVQNGDSIFSNGFDGCPPLS